MDSDMLSGAFAAAAVGAVVRYWREARIPTRPGVLLCCSSRMACTILSLAELLAGAV